MKTVWKFTLKHNADFQQFTAPGLGRIVHYAIQDGRHCFWAEVVQSNPDRSLTVVIFGTGNEIPEPLIHCGSIQDGSFVWHLYQSPFLHTQEIAA